MSRVRRGNVRKNRRKKILKQAKGYYGLKSRGHRIAKQAVDRSLAFAYRDRRQKKRQFRALWIVRINAAAREHGLSYSRFISGLKAAGSTLDRKVLADLAVQDAAAFAGLAAMAREALGEPAPPEGSAKPEKAEEKTSEAKKAETKKADAKKADAKKAETKTAEPKKAEAEKPEPKKAEAKKAEAKKDEGKKAEAEKAEAEKADAEQPEPEKAAAKAEAPKAEAPKADAKPEASAEAEEEAEG